MTQPNGNATLIELPAAHPPILRRVVSDPIFNEQPEALVWTHLAPHPLAGPYKVIRMFFDRGGVEIYSVSDDGKAGMRNCIPTSRIRFTEEAMPLDVFAGELNAAEFEAAPVGPLSVEASDDDDEDDEDETEPEPELAPEETSAQPPS